MRKASFPGSGVSSFGMLLRSHDLAFSVFYLILGRDARDDPFCDLRPPESRTFQPIALSYI